MMKVKKVTTNGKILKKNNKNGNENRTIIKHITFKNKEYK